MKTQILSTGAIPELALDSNSAATNRRDVVTYNECSNQVKL